MCWNKEVSLSTFALISIICYGLWKRDLLNDRMMAIFIMGYGSMQLAETIIWIGLENNNSGINKFGTILACLILYVQPLAFMMGIKYDKMYKDIVNDSVFKILTILTIISFIIGIINIIYTNDYISYTIKESQHIIWKVPYSLPIHYLVALLISIVALIYYVFPKNKIYAIFLFLYFGITVIYSIYISPKGFKYKLHRSYWCWLVAILAFLLYFINPFFQRYNITK